MDTMLHYPRRKTLFGFWLLFFNQLLFTIKDINFSLKNFLKDTLETEDLVKQTLRMFCPFM